MKIWGKNEEGAELRKRFDDLKKSKGISRAAFARENGLKGGDSLIYQHITGHRPMSIDAAIIYAKAFGCELSEISPRLAIEVNEMALAVKGDDVKSDAKSSPILDFAKSSPSVGMKELITLAGQLDTLRLGMLVKTARDLVAEMPAKQTPESSA